MSVQRVMVVPSNPAVRKVAQQEVGVIAVQSLSSRPEGGAAGSEGEVIFGGLSAVVQCRPLKLNGKPARKGRRRLEPGERDRRPYLAADRIRLRAVTAAVLR